MIDEDVGDEGDEIYEPPPNQAINRVQTTAAHTAHRGNYAEIENDRRQQVVPAPARAPAVPRSKHWEIPPIQCFEPDDGVFYAQMGPTGGKQGYPAITGLLHTTRWLFIIMNHPHPPRPLPRSFEATRIARTHTTASASQAHCIYRRIYLN